MANSVTDICNSALQRVGASTILNILDNTAEARACNVAYDSNRRDELRKYKWRFAIKRVVLAQDATTPAFDFKYQYTIPYDCLRIIFPSDYQNDWVLEGKKILSNNDKILNLRYISDITDTTLFDASFYNVIAGALAIDICERLTQSSTKKKILIDQYNMDVANAKLADSFEINYTDPPDDLWEAARI
jgi:hypothetical protein